MNKHAFLSGYFGSAALQPDREVKIDKTLWDTARKYKVPLDTLEQTNFPLLPKKPKGHALAGQIDYTRIQPDQRLYVPPMEEEGLPGNLSRPITDAQVAEVRNRPSKEQIWKKFNALFNSPSQLAARAKRTK
jgi:hypothetical protein